MKSPTRRYRGFVVVERPGGSLIWGTFRPTADEALATFQKWNPLPEQRDQAQLVSAEIIIRPV